MQWLFNIPQVEEYQGMLENSGLVGYAQEVLKESDQSCFVQTAKQLHVRYSWADSWNENPGGGKSNQSSLT